MNKRFTATGHLIDSGILTKILNLIVDEGGAYEVIRFEICKTHTSVSTLEFELHAGTRAHLDTIAEKLGRLGCYEQATPDTVVKPAVKDKTVPDDFYSTTNHRTEVYINGSWQVVANQRMDGVIVISPDGPECKKLRDVKQGDMIVCSATSVRVFPPEREREGSVFGFMENEVSSERSVEVTVSKIASELENIKKGGGKTVVVAGPVVIHTGGSEALSYLIREGYVQGLLSGNALAVHDIESVFFGTSLGIDLVTGKPTHEGHRNHMRAINRIYSYGSIEQAVEAGALNRVIMYELTKKNIPYCLAGSIRDDGPLPETENDMIRAQAEYSRILEGTQMVLMLSSMLHSIGTGNMLPSWVKVVCVDINPAVVTKLSDRGSSQAIGIVSDVGLFLCSLAEKLGLKK